MAEVGLVFLSAALTTLFDRMISREVLNFMMGRKLTEELLRKLKTTVLSMNFVLEDAEEKQLTKPSVKNWVDELRDALYDAEDILDEIATEALQRELGTSTAEKVSDWVDKFFNKLDQNIKELLDRLEDLAKQKDVMGLQVGVGGKQYPQKLSTSYVPESDTFGRVEDKEKIINLLRSSSDAIENQMCVIAIVGMGGIGKTTLAQLAYNDCRVDEDFELKIWFCVSEEFAMPTVEKSIIEAATSLPCPEFKNPEQLRVILKKNLDRKKFLLVLDDVWSEKPIHQEFLSQLLHYGTPGSKILLTTRNKSVALAMKANATHHLEVLPKKYCQSLFEKHAFHNGSSDADSKIKEIGTQIVDKCKGLPLAIKAIGNLLWSESNVERWTNILKSNLWDLPMEGTYILPALRLSYNYLPSYLKKCFAYCSIFPKDHIFEKDQLVLLWMAEGFLQQSEILTMEEVGNHYFDALVSRSLFQQLSHETKPLFVMHDLVNDLAKSVAGQFGTDSFKNIVKMTRYVSHFGESGMLPDIRADLLKAKQLRTFFPSRFPGSQFWDIKIQRTMLCLRVFSLGNIADYWSPNLPDSIGEMKYLRYLDVSGAKFNRLPDSICNLCNLQTLKLSECSKLDRLPRDMWKLSNLRHLEIDGTYNLMEMPIQMGRLNCLQTLPKFVVSKHDSANGYSSIGDLRGLKNLRGNLLIQELQNVRSTKDDLNASLGDKAYLENLVLKWSFSLPSVLDIPTIQRGVLENLQPHKNLKCLTINYYCGNGFPDWIGGLHSLSMLRLTKCKYCHKLPTLGHLPSLNELYIDGLDTVATVGPEFYGNSSNSLMKPFGSLKFLKLEDMLNWEEWSVQNEVETFSQLEELYIKNCPKLRATLCVHPPSLAKLDINDCKLELPRHQQFSSLKELLLKNCCDSLTSFSLHLFPNLKSLRIEGCKNLQSLEQHGGDSAISKIEICKCPNFVSFPEGGLRAPNLTMFSLKICESLGAMPCEMHLLRSLRNLKLENCPNVGLFPKGGLPSNLKQIVILTCEKLIANRKGWGLQTLPSLEWLEIGDDKSEDHVESFPGELSLPTTLTYLCIKAIGNLKSLDKKGFQHLTSLEELKIIDCPKLRYMPEVGFPTSLHFLEIKNVNDGEEWRKVDRVPNIRIDGRKIRGHKEWPVNEWDSSKIIECSAIGMWRRDQYY